MRRPATITVALLALLFPSEASAQKRSVAIFDFELTDTSRHDQLATASAELEGRLALVSGQLRKRFAESERYTIIDIAPVRAEARANNLQACGGCGITLASQIGAELAVTGLVYKISNLILRMTIIVDDVKTERNIAIAQAGMRGDTDETWTRTVDWLMKYRLFDPDRGLRHR